MKNIRAGLLLALCLACSYSGWADSGAQDRSNAFGYQFNQQELDSFPQKTNLPTVYLQIYKTDYDAETDKSSIRINSEGNAELEALNYIFHDEKKHDWYYRAKIIIRDDWGTIKERNEWLGVRGRGNSTWHIGYFGDTYWQPKKPFRLKFDTKADLLTGKNESGEIVNDYATDKNWTLLANYYDATLIRNGLAAALQKRMGMPFVPAAKYVDLVINNQYFGTYQISDHVNIADRRVPIDEDTGYFFEGNVLDPNGRFQEDPYIAINFGSNGSDYGADFLLNVKNPDPDIATESGTSTDPKYNDVKAKLEKVAKLLYKPETDTDDTWRRYVEMQPAVDAFIVSELSANYDATYGNNYFYMNNIDSKIVFCPIWDLDLTWNYKIDSKDIQGKHFWEFKITPFSQLCEKAYNDPYFMKAVYERWQELNNNGLETFLKETAQELKNTVSQSAALNYTSRDQGGAGAYYNLNSWNDNNYYNSLDEAYTVLTNFVTDRVTYVQTEFKKQYDNLGCATLECPGHNYTDCMFALQSDGTYRRTCNVCGETEESGTPYYYFTVYPESSSTNSFYATSWTPDKGTPNAIATVDVDASAMPEGYNIVNARKDAAGNKTCADFRLVDGHPFYSDDKFVATKATYSRSVTNTWGTMILPFKYQQAETETARFFHIGSVEEDSEGRTTLVMTPIDPSVEGNASAYVPVVFMAIDNAKEVEVTGENVTVKKVGKNTSWADSTVEGIADGWTLTGVMEKTAFSVNDDAFAEKDVYYISKNEFWHAMGNLTTNPFRAYLTTAKSSNGARSIRLATDDDPSMVKSLSADECLALFVSDGQLTVVAPKAMDVTVSNLGGSVVCRKQVQAGQRLDLQLPKGVYVVNGVKVIVK